MELNFLEKKKSRVVLELEGGDHTFCNILKKELWNDKNVKVSAYSIEHPLVGSPKIIVETGTGDAMTALDGAVSRLEKINKSFLTELKKAK